MVGGSPTYSRVYCSHSTSWALGFHIKLMLVNCGECPMTEWVCYFLLWKYNPHSFIANSPHWAWREDNDTTELLQMIIHIITVMVAGEWIQWEGEQHMVWTLWNSHVVSPCYIPWVFCRCSTTQWWWPTSTSRNKVSLPLCPLPPNKSCLGWNFTLWSSGQGTSPTRKTWWINLVTIINLFQFSGLSIFVSWTIDQFAVSWNEKLQVYILLPPDPFAWMDDAFQHLQSHL